jgi:hypothetical protein
MNMHATSMQTSDRISIAKYTVIRGFGAVTRIAGDINSGCAIIQTSLSLWERAGVRVP